MQLRVRSIEIVPVRVTREELYRVSHRNRPRRRTVIARAVSGRLAHAG